MALGGGNWTAQDKVLPGTYINFANPLKSVGGLGERGIVAVPLSLKWGPESTVFTLNAEDIGEKSGALLGYPLTAPELTALRELFRNAKKVLCYRLEKNPERAENSFCKARYGGIRGNDLKTVITESADREGFYRVMTLLDGLAVDIQEVETAAGLKDNDYVSFLPEATLAATAGLSMTGGTQGAAVTAAEYAAFLTAAESYSFHILCCPAAEKNIIELFKAYARRQVEESGAPFQLVCYRPENPDWEGIIAVQNEVLSGLPEYGLVYWAAGAEAACPLNQALTGRKYDGELTVDLGYSQAGLKAGIASGWFMLHGVEGEARVLRDINSLVTLTEGKGADFTANQTVRVLSSIGARVAGLFNGKYLGSVANDDGGRISLWNDICRILADYQDAHAIEAFRPEDVEVVPGESKQNVVCRVKRLTVAGAMEALYMNIIII